MNSRRNFIKATSAAGTGLLFMPEMAFTMNAQKSQLKVGLIGVGLRGTNHLDNLLLRDDVEVTALCDIDPARIDLCRKKIREAGKPAPKMFGKDEYDYRNLLDLQEVDAVIIATPWLWHVRMAGDAMKAGKYTGVEVSAANTLEECWDLVNIHEETGTHLMILENVNYRRDVMAVLHMVRQGLFGELVHFRCGYQHDLRHVKFNDGKQPYGGGVEFGENAISEAKWRTQHSLRRNADVYPTHGLGPVATMADINRGNRFVSLTAHATKAVGLHNYIVNHPQGGANHPNADLKWKQGDVITTTIGTAKGETIIITHDCNLPRPYSLGFRVQGVNGLTEFDYYDKRIYVEGKSDEHQWEKMDDYLDRYDHPLWKKYGEYAAGSGHGGMDFFVINAFVESAKQNIAPPLDVYDAAAWSSVTPLSEASIANNGAPQDFPDFTRGNWIKRTPYNWMKDTY
ncbi:Gfo/Idh/MocA family protein [Robertkochia flava]|uniref:Gfo/Idh/MocA family protein n=1 Tax=Robertkochia flava TaxID=3447986 RepID=UPI001CCBD266|nr:Gfo/Idh/MocA family oxidoreductase [Robertkochia marina]